MKLLMLVGSYSLAVAECTPIEDGGQAAMMNGNDSKDAMAAAAHGFYTNVIR